MRFDQYWLTFSLFYVGFQPECDQKYPKKASKFLHYSIELGELYPKKLHSST